MSDGSLRIVSGNGRLHVLGRSVQIAIQVKLQSDLRHSRELVELMAVTPAMVVNWRSKGVATEAAMFSGLAPGRLALTIR